MSGPSYPLPSPTGPEGVTKFQIWDTIISQYANSDILTTLCTNINEYLDQTANLDAFYQYIWNVDTAQGYGLDVWGRIVGVNRILQVVTGDYLGFKEALPGSDTFGQGPFYAGAPLTTNYALSDEAYRMLIFAKALANITDGSIPAINQILLNLFPGRGNCYVTEDNTSNTWFGFAEAGAKTFGEGTFYNGSAIQWMRMTYTFEFALTAVELAIVQNSGVLPKPTGVAATVVVP